MAVVSVYVAAIVILIIAISVNVVVDVGYLGCINIDVTILCTVITINIFTYYYGIPDNVAKYVVL